MRLQDWNAKRVRSSARGGKGMPALIGVGLAGGAAMACWLMTMATVHQVSAGIDPLSRPRFDASLGLASVAPAPQERRLHPPKFARLGRAPLDVAARAVTHPETPQAALKVQSAKLGLALALAKSNADLRPAMQVAAAVPAPSPNDAAPAPATIGTISAVHVAAVAAPKLPPAPVLPAAPAVPTVALPSQMDIAEAEAAPIRPHAMVEPSPEKNGTVSGPFSLVLSNAETTEPLPDLGPMPLSRPGAATEARRLAPAKVEDDDDDDDAKPSVVRRKPARTELAYAKPDAPIEDEAPVRAPVIGRGVAVYDISAGRVHMPNGEVLEAHSGIGKMRDNPDFVHVPMRGPTPPGTYKVTLREAKFHGVEAVRLTPIDGVAPHGRVGLLAHSYLLRTRGDSHGCVAFADYPRFLKAFKRGEISQMVIVKSMRGGFSPQKKTLASLFSWGK